MIIKTFHNNHVRFFLRLASIAVLVFLSPFSLMASFMIVLGMMPPGGALPAITFAIGTFTVTASAIITLVRPNVFAAVGLVAGFLLWYVGLF